MLNLFKKREPKETLYYEHFSQVNSEDWSWQNFSPEELASRTVFNGKRGPKGPLLVNIRALNMLQDLRYSWGSPLYINSAYRSPTYNTFIGGAEKSKHMDGIAFDVAMGPTLREQFISRAIAIGFKGIGRYNSFVHIDARIQDYVSYWDKRK